MSSLVKGYLALGLEDRSAGGVVELDLDALVGSGLEQPLQRSLEVFEGIHQDLKEVDRIQTSLESYHSLLSMVVDHGKEICPTTARAIQVGLEGLDPMFSYEYQTLDGDVTTVSMEKLAEAFSVAMKAAGRAIDKLFAVLYELWVNLTSGLSRTEKRLEALLKRIDAVETDVSRVVSVKGGTRLMVRDDFRGNDLASLRDLNNVARFMYDDYPRQIEGLIRDAVALFSKVPVSSSDKDKTSSHRAQAIMDFQELPRKHFRPIPNNIAAKPSELPPDLAKFPGLKRSPILPGNHALVMGVREDMFLIKGTTAGDADVEIPRIYLTVFRFLDRLLVVEFTRLEVQSKKTEVKYELPTRQELRNMVRELQGILKYAMKAGETKAGYARLKTETEKQIRYITYSTSTHDERMEDLRNRTNSSIFAGSLRSLLRKAVHPTGHFIGYLGSTVNAYVGLIEYNLTQLEKATKGERASQPALPAPT